MTLNSGKQGRWPLKALGSLLLLFSIVALLIAPMLMPDDYAWLRHTTSESAAQGVEGAWLARMGFLLFGFVVLWQAADLQISWPPPVRWLIGIFGVMMTATAAFSSKPWRKDAPFDPIEDGLHSFTATAMGFAFAFAATVRFFHRDRDPLGRVMDLIAIAAATAIPISMGIWPDWAGLLQRGMFTIAYLWYGFEMWRPAGE